MIYFVLQIVEAEVRDDCNVTGLLMSQGNSLIHMMEGPSQAVLNILTKLAIHNHFQSTNSGSDPIQRGRIVYYVEDRPKRFFSEWYSCDIQERKTAIEDVTADTCKDVVHDMATKLLELGGKLSRDANHEEPELSR